MFTGRARLSLLVVAGLCLGVQPARAQFAVIDVASVTQLIQQVKTLTQQLEAARAQIAQAQALYQSTTGDRGMESLLSGISRNYLPTTWAQLIGSTQTSAGGFGPLASDLGAMVAANAVLTAPQLATLPGAAQTQVKASRNAVALLQAVAQEALSNSSSRFASLQQLIGTIPAASDQKAILDLQARIAVELGMLQNEQTKLQSLYQAAQSQGVAADQRVREQIIAGHGSFAGRFEPAP